MAGRTKAQIEAENRVLRRFRMAEGVASVLNNLVRWGALFGIAYLARDSVVALAGKSTAADIGVSVLTDIRISEVFAWVLGGTGVAFGLGQNHLRKRTVERLQDRVQKFETEKDPGRTSSHLTPRGETRPEDE